MTFRLLKNFRDLGHGKRTPPRDCLAEGFAFHKFHRDVGRAVIGLAGFVNGDDVRVKWQEGPRALRLRTLSATGQERVGPSGARPWPNAIRPYKSRRPCRPRLVAGSAGSGGKTGSEMGLDLSHSGESHGCSGALRAPNGG